MLVIYEFSVKVYCINLTFNIMNFTKVSRIAITLSLICVFHISFAQTQSSGLISGNITWTKAEGPYIINSITIPQGSSLTIEPGTIIKVKNGSYPFTVDGALTIGGANAEQVIITAESDDTQGGDTNGDGDATIPSPGSWQSILLDNDNNATITIVNTTILYGGGSQYSYWTGGSTPLPTIQNYGGTLALDHVHMSASGNSGIQQSAGATTVTNSSFDHFGRFGVWNTGGYVASINNTFDTMQSGVEISAGTLELEGNMFQHVMTAANVAGTAILLNHGNNTGSGGIMMSNAISGTTTWTADTLPYIANGATIPQGASLTIAPGTIIKVPDNVTPFTVDGALTIGANNSATTTITSLKDDSVGGDTNNDGTTTSPTGDNNWRDIIVNATGVVVIQNTTISYGGANMPNYWNGSVFHFPLIQNNGGVLMVDHSTLFGSANNAVEQGSGNTEIMNSSIVNIAGYGVQSRGGYLHVASTTFDTMNTGITTTAGTLEIKGNAFAHTSAYPVLLSGIVSLINHGGNVGSGGMFMQLQLQADQVLPKDGLPYILADTIVPVNTTLTILPGAVLKVPLDTNPLTISGTLIVGSSTSSEPVIITSIYDDSVLGDTNNDGTTTAVHSGDWRTITLNQGAVATLTNTSVSYGGGSFFNYWTGGTTYLPEINTSGVLTIANSKLLHNGNYGIMQSQGTTTITDSEIATTDHYGLFVTGGVLSIHSSSLHDNLIEAIDNSTGRMLDATNNWWGDVSGPSNAIQNPQGTGDKVSDNVLIAPWLASDPVGKCTINCFDNVLFLPGIKGSRLYRPDYNGGYDQLWEPTSDADAVDLRLSPDDGSSVREDIYTKKNDVIDAAFGIAPVYYGAFIGDMDALKTSGKIKDWEAVPYDWRLSVNRIINRGAEINGRIYYDGALSATTSPYIIQELKRLAASSKTGKVTIIAHSNGGLVTKALIKKLQDAHDPILEKIDKVIFVAVPQSGTPHALGVLLHGYKEGLPGIFPEWVPGVPRFLTEHAARTLAENAPVAYNLLPSLKYFSDVADPRFPVVHFNSTTLYQQEQAHYGNTIDTANEMNDFLLARDGGRTKPDETNLSVPNVLNPNLIALGTSTHSSLDEWMPPASLQLYQIAGWGNDTLAGIDYYDQLKTRCIAQGQSSCAQFGRVPTATYKPILTEDGDSVVVTPSAIAILESANVQRYWVKLAEAGQLHGDILKNEDLRNFIINIINNNATSSSDMITHVRPTAIDIRKRLHYFLHSPLALSVADSEGHISGYSSTTKQIESQIPGVSYGEFGEVKYITVPADLPLKLHLDGYATGTFALDIEEVTGGVVTASTTFADVPTSSSTKVTMDMNGSIASSSPLRIDENGDGQIDFVLAPKVGATVMFDTTAPEALITFSTSVNTIYITGIDETSSTTISSTTTYPILKKNQKQYNGIATTTVTIKDVAGNTTKLIYAEKLPSPVKRDFINLVAISYNGATSSIPATLKYAWGMKNDGTYKKFASVFATSTVVIESHYRPKKNITILMNKPIDMDDSDNDAEDGDDVDTRPIKTKLTGFVVPSIVTKQGKISVTY